MAMVLVQTLAVRTEHSDHGQGLLCTTLDCSASIIGPGRGCTTRFQIPAATYNVNLYFPL